MKKELVPLLSRFPDPASGRDPKEREIPPVGGIPEGGTALRSLTSVIGP